MKNRRRKWACFFSAFITMIAFSMTPFSLYCLPIAAPLIEDATVIRQKLLVHAELQNIYETTHLSPADQLTLKQTLNTTLRLTQKVATNYSLQFGRDKLSRSSHRNFRKNNGLHRRRNIFMLETSGKSTMTPRQACAVESAARMNPNMDVILYMTATNINLSDDYMSTLVSIKNLKVVHLDLNKLFKGSRLESWYTQGQWLASSYKISHMSDAIRFLTLYQNGGIYLDLDVVVIKSLEELQNCAGLEDSIWVAAGVMAFDKGHFFTKLCLEEFAEHYDSSRWGYNGPELLTRVFKRVCGGIEDLKDINRHNCQGVTVLPPRAFYAIPWQRWKDFFTEEEMDNVVDKWSDSFLIHVWNSFSATTPVIIGSNQPYEIAARKYCPHTYRKTVKQGLF